MQAKFTFHNVSINSGERLKLSLSNRYLHSTMFLLIRYGMLGLERLQGYLHSTMFLLILKTLLPVILNCFIYIPQCFY